MNIQTCKFITISELLEKAGIPSESVDDDFFDAWSFGDANRTLISKERLVNRCESVNEVDLLEFMKSIPDDIYIDLEN